ncbi:MAG: aspartate aminotransferase family protein [Desulfobacteraceae bacterium]|jgi:acetylornithine/N-succinyldiaminopimelate aminotransferase
MNETIETEDKHIPDFFKKVPISVEYGRGVYVWDETGKKYLDFTAGWGVTCIGHANEVIVRALNEQGKKIIQNPNSGLTYSPARTKLIRLLLEILPEGLTRVFFTNSGAEANDAAIKLARKTTGKMDVISTHHSFHGRTISTASATGQAKHREKFNPLMPNYRFVNYGNLPEMESALDNNVAAVILEPVQGEGGVNIPPENYLSEVKAMCEKNGTLLIVDEVQTGFCRTGPIFVSSAQGVCPDILTMAKGIAGGFPFGAFAMTEEVNSLLEPGDHGGTYCGNPLGCAVSGAVIEFLLENRVWENVEKAGQYAFEKMNMLKTNYPGIIKDIRGQGLLLLMEIADDKTASEIADKCLFNGLLLNMIQGKCIRIIPALNITPEELDEGLSILEKVMGSIYSGACK